MLLSAGVGAHKHPDYEEDGLRLGRSGFQPHAEISI